jgi:hypothetical protein
MDEHAHRLRVRFARDLGIVGDGPAAGCLRCSPSRSLPHKGTPTFYPLKRMKDRMRNSHDPLRVHVLKQSSPTSPGSAVLLGGGKGEPHFKRKLQHPVRAKPGQNQSIATRKRVTERDLKSPFCAAEGWQLNWDEGEHCLSSAAACVLCKLSGRVAQPPNLTAKPKVSRRDGAAGCLFVWLLYFGQENKVTCCRAAPGKLIKCARNAPCNSCKISYYKM